MRLKIEFIDASEFHEYGAEESILVLPPASDRTNLCVRPRDGLPPYLASLAGIPVLTKEEEVYYFRKMNYLKFKASELRRNLNPLRSTTRDVDEVMRLIQHASEVRSFLTRSNLRLVVSIARKFLRPKPDFFDLVSDGNLSLIRAIEKFDFARGFKFSTYASRTIMRYYARSLAAEQDLKRRYRTGYNETISRSFGHCNSSALDVLKTNRRYEALMGIVSKLSTSEQVVIGCRFGLGDEVAPETLAQVSARLGVCRERVRQIEVQALHKLRKMAESKHLCLSGFTAVVK